MNKNFYFFTVTPRKEDSGHDLKVYKTVLRWPYNPSRLLEESIGFVSPAVLIHEEECGMEVSANKLGRSAVRSAILEDRQKALSNTPSLL